MPPRRLSALLLVCVAQAYFGSLLYAARASPSGYDWRHTVISNLANPNANPSAWRVAADGMAVTGFLLALLGLEVCRTLRPLAPRWAAWTCAFFVLGGTLLTVSSLILPGHHALFGIGKAHAKIAQAAGLSFGLGLACTLPALLRLPARQAGLRVAAVALVAVPMTVFLVCRMLVPVVEAHVPPDQRPAVHYSMLGGLAFWEWIGSTTVYAFMALITLIPSDSSSGTNISRSRA